MHEKVKAFNQLMNSYSGTAYEMLDDEGRDLFTPYASKSDLFFRAASIVIAPVAGGVYAVEGAVVFLYKILKAVVDLVMLNPRQASEDLGYAASGALVMILGAVFAAISPVINLVDFVGSGVTSMLPAAESPVLSV